MVGYTFTLAKDVNLLLRTRRLLLEPGNSKHKAFYRQVEVVSKRLSFIRKPILELTTALRVLVKGLDVTLALPADKGIAETRLRKLDTFAKYAKAVHAPGFLAQRGVAMCLFDGLRGRLDKVYDNVKAAVDTATAFAWDKVLPEEEEEEEEEKAESTAKDAEEEAAFETLTGQDKDEEDGKSPLKIFKAITGVEEESEGS